MQIRTINTITIIVEDVQYSDKQKYQDDLEKTLDLFGKYRVGISFLY